MCLKGQKCEVWLHEYRKLEPTLNYKRESMSLKITNSLYKEKYKNLGK